MNSATDSSNNRFQLAGWHTTVRITGGGEEFPLVTRLHLIHWDNRVLTNILYLTSQEHGQLSWIVGFDPVINNVCPFASRREVAVALGCFLDSTEFAQILNNIDISECRKLIQAIYSRPEERAKKILLQLCKMLNISVLANEGALRSKSRAKSLEGSPTSQQENISLKLILGDIDLTDGIVNMCRVGGQNVEDTLLLTLNVQATTDLILADYNDAIRLWTDIGQGWEAIFRGLVKEARVENTHGKIYLTCRSYGLTLEEYVIPGLNMTLSRPKEGMYFILCNSGWQPEDIHIEGLDTSGAVHLYIVLTPILNVDANDPFGIGDVLFARLEKEIKGDLQSSNLTLGSGWEDQIWARVYVSAPNFYDAQVSGIAKIDAALDLLASVKSDSKPFVLSDTGYLPIAWRRSDRLHRIMREPWVYIRDLGTRDHIIANLDIVTESIKLEMTTPLRHRLDKGTDVFQILFQKPWSALTKNEQGLVYALHWLRRAWDEGDGIDKLMYLWNALEFIVGTVQLPHLFSIREMRSIKEFDYDTVINDDPQKEFKIKRLDEVFGMLNNPSLLVKLRHLINKGGITISEGEWLLIKKARKKRNDLIHGRSSIDFGENEARKLAFIVGKIITGLLMKT